MPAARAGRCPGVHQANRHGRDRDGAEARDRRRKRTWPASIAQMLTLNRRACEAMLRFDVHGCTDVTGFGLIGHAREMALASNVLWRSTVDRSAVPARRRGIRAPGRGARRLEQQPRVRFVRGGERCANCRPKSKTLLYDPQTSGGLLITLPEADAAALERSLDASLPHRPRAAARSETDPTYMNAKPHHRCPRLSSPPRRLARWSRVWAPGQLLQGRHGTLRRRRHGIRPRIDAPKARTFSWI